MQMDGTPELKLEPIEVHHDVMVQRLLNIAEHVMTLAVGVCPGKISPNSLLQDVCHLQGLQHRKVGGFLTVFLSNPLDETRPRKGPLVGADR